MLRPALTILSAGLLVTALPLPLLASDAAAEGIRITDPALLESLGFEPEATNVYATAQALRRTAMDPAERVAADGELLAATEAAPFGGPYGPNDGFTTLHHTAFRPVLSTSLNPAEYQHSAGEGLACFGGWPSYEAAFESLPHGARLSSVQVYVYDVSDENMTASLYRECQSSPNAAPDFMLLDQASTVGSPTHAGLLLVAGNETINNRQCSYVVRVAFDSTSGVACSEGGELVLTRARAAWQRQVSPAPGTATFDDVPTSHLFFQHIEALAASQITVGCDADNFCPDAPLTRGQMAVFLAKALGLHWGTF